MQPVVHGRAGVFPPPPPEPHFSPEPCFSLEPHFRIESHAHAKLRVLAPLRVYSSAQAVLNKTIPAELVDGELAAFVDALFAAHNGTVC